MVPSSETPPTGDSAAPATNEPTVITPSNRTSPRPKLWRRLMPSIASLILTAFMIFSLLINGDFEPLVRRGFFCGDASIRYPFRKSTVTMVPLFLITLFIPGIVIKICDTLLTVLLRARPGMTGQRQTFNLNLERTDTIDRRRKISHTSARQSQTDDEEGELLNDVAENPIEKVTTRRRRLVLEQFNGEYEAVNGSETSSLADSDQSNGPDVELLSRNSNKQQNRYNADNHLSNKLTSLSSIILQRPYGEFHLFFFGFSVTMLFTGIGKMACGRLRPHFMQVCQPDVNCSTVSPDKYILDYSCTSRNNFGSYIGAAYITTSWPSGHAALMFYSMLYLILYLNTVIPSIVHFGPPKLRQLYNPLILYTIFLLMVTLAGYVSATRVSDFHHHSTDVLSGAVIGSIIALALERGVSSQYSRLVKSLANSNC